MCLVDPLLFSTVSDTSWVFNKNVCMLMPENLNLNERKRTGSINIKTPEGEVVVWEKR